MAVMKWACGRPLCVPSSKITAWYFARPFGYFFGAAYTLVCDAGAYTITGAPMTPYHNKKIVCDAGTLVITGAAMSPYHNKKITLAPGEYLITGKDVTLTYSGGVVTVYGQGWHMFLKPSMD